MDDLSGHSIKGYELRERIGTGGFGAVYRAVQSTVGREVAVKIILPGFANQPDFIRRFETEAQIIARLEHLHVVPLYDYWRGADGAYLVMRWLRGGSLRDALERSGAYELENAVLLIDQIAAGLDVAHRHNVIHRDLKPGNILLDEDGNAYLADFGIAKDLTSTRDSTTQPDTILGSPEYLAPEQARSEPVTAQTDIYSLGVVLYEMLSGQHPFPKLSAVETLFKHLNEPLPYIDRLPADTRDAVNAVIQKATAKNPQHRYEDALALAAAFREAAALDGKASPENVVEVLTPREQEILQAVIAGRSNKEIATQLFVTVATVKWYITQIYRKLGVRSRVQAIVRARELHLISSFVAEGTDALATTIIPTDQFKPENPYKGLRPFESVDTRDFFGREKLVAKLIKRLGEKDEFSRFLAVIGPSGSGKSSAVKAGLIPALWRGDLPGSEKWFVAEMIPGARPLDELEVALTRLATNPADLHEQLARDAYGLLRAVNLVLPNDGSELVLVIDQFEELFTLVAEEAARAHFLHLLHKAVTEPRSRVRVVITLRADFYDRPLHYPDFGALVLGRMETVLPLSTTELERAIVAPAERVGATFEQGLVAAIIEEILYQPGALPLLQYALTELFEARQGKLLTNAAYQQIGGAVSALARRAEALYLEFAPESQAAVHQMFLRLVTLGEGVEDTRRRVSRSELLAIVPDADLMDEVLDTFAEYRLISLDHDPATRSPTVELAHEALLREWERLSHWLDSSRSEIRMQRQLAYAVREWEEGKQDDSFLLHGARLSQFESWAATTGIALTPKERAYLQGSLANRDRETAAEQERAAREVRLERRSQTFLRGIIVVLLLATLGAFALTGVAVNQRNSAERSAAVSQSLALAAAAQLALGEGNTDRALALASAANTIDTAPVFAQRVLYAASAAPGTIWRRPCSTLWCSPFTVSADEQRLLTGDDHFAVVLSDLNTGAVIRKFEGGHTEFIDGFGFLPDGKRIISSGFDDQMVLWDINTGEILRRYESPYGDFNLMDVSPDGKLVATATQDGVPLIWDVDTGAIVHELIGHERGLQIQPVTFSPDGRSLLTGSEDTTMILWDVQTGELIRRFAGHTNLVIGAQFSPDGRSALSTSFDNTMILWDIATGQAIRHFAGHTNFVFDARFTPDGARILSASRDGTMILWDVASGERLHTYVGEAGLVLNVELLANGTQALSSHNTGVLRRWQLEEQTVVQQFGEPIPPSDDAVFDDTLNIDGDLLALSPDGRWAAAPGGVNAAEVLLWDTATGTLIRRFSGQEGHITSISFSPDRQRLLSSSWDKTLILWDTNTGQMIRRFSGHELGVFDAAFSPDGSLIVSGSEDRTLRLWNAQTGELLREPEEFGDSVNTVAFSPDGRTILAGLGTIRPVGEGTEEDYSLRLFDSGSGEEIHRFEGHSAAVTTASFSPDGKTILSGSMDATLRLWDAATGSEIRRFIGHATTVWSVGFSPDGRYAISGAQDGTVIVWDLSTGEALRSLDNDGAMAQGAAFTADGTMVLTSSANGMLHLWRLTLGLSDLRNWAQNHRYVRDLACSERDLFRVLPLCGKEQVETNGTA